MRVLVWFDKHGQYYYDASTDEALNDAAREIIKDLFGNGYIYEPSEPDTYGIDMEQANLTDDQINALPTEKMQKEARKHKANLAQALRRHELELKEYQDFKDASEGKPVYKRPWRRAADSRDGKYKAGDIMPATEISPWALLQQRNGYEYERFELEDVWQK